MLAGSAHKPPAALRKIAPTQLLSCVGAVWAFQEGAWLRADTIWHPIGDRLHSTSNRGWLPSRTRSRVAIRHSAASLWAWNQLCPRRGLLRQMRRPSSAALLALAAVLLVLVAPTAGAYAWGQCGGLNGPGGSDAVGASCPGGYLCIRQDK
ncbi:MAG: hypothetical protein J3K34DRAFT_146626 [Monoraphidium minutum]|nr:MAG: hypothetical protein J3K34DRAFT_146626 [Monoraphidium minutum]